MRAFTEEDAGLGRVAEYVVRAGRWVSALPTVRRYRADHDVAVELGRAILAGADPWSSRQRVEAGGGEGRSRRILEQLRMETRVDLARLAGLEEGEVVRCRERRELSHESKTWGESLNRELKKKKRLLIRVDSI